MINDLEANVYFQLTMFVDDVTFFHLDRSPKSLHEYTGRVVHKANL